MRNLLEKHLALLLLLSATAPAVAETTSLPLPRPATIGVSSSSDPNTTAYNSDVPAYNAAVSNFSRATREYATAQSGNGPAAWGTALADVRQNVSEIQALLDDLAGKAHVGDSLNPSKGGANKDVAKMEGNLRLMRDYLFQIQHDDQYDAAIKGFGAATESYRTAKVGSDTAALVTADAAMTQSAAAIQALLQKPRYQNSEGETLQSMLGYQSLLRGDATHAVSSLETAVRLNPNDIDARYNLGNEFQEVQPPRYAEAADQYRAVLALLENPSGAGPKTGLAPHRNLTANGVKFNLATALGQAGQMDEALKTFKEIADPSQNPSAAVLKNYGFFLDKAGNELEAAQALDQAAQADPKDAVTWLNAGTLYAKLGKNDQATTDLNNAIGPNVAPPLSAANAYSAHFALGQAYATGDPNRAITEFKAASQLQPDLPKPLYNEGVLEQQRNLNADAEASFRAANALADKLDATKDPNAVQTQAQAEAALGLLLAKEGRTADLAEAASLLSQAAAKIPQDVKAAPIYARLGDVYAKQNDTDKAEQARVQALALDPADANTRLALADSYVAQKQYVLALAQYDQASRDIPNDSAHRTSQAAIQNQRGVIYENLRQYKKAQEAFQQALVLNPYLAPAQNNLGVTYELLNKNSAAARVAYRKAHKLDSGLPEAGFNLNRPMGSSPSKSDEDAYSLGESGMAYFKLKRYDKALFAFKRASKLDPDSAPILNDVGAAYAMLGNRKAARAAFAQALTLNPTLSVARQNLGDTRSQPQLVSYERHTYR